MKRYFTLCLFLFSGFLLHAQGWGNFKLNNIADVTVPGPIDTLTVEEQTIYRAIAPEGIITMFVSSDKNSPAAKPRYEELREIYAGLINGIIKQGNGTLIDSTRVMSGKLEGKHLRFEINANGQSRILDCQAFVIRNKIYAFQFVQEKIIYNENAPSRDRFFKSIHFSSSLTASDQYTDQREQSMSNAYNFGRMAGYLSVFIGVIALIVVLIVRSTRR